MEYREDIGFQIRTLSHLVKRTVDQAAFDGVDDHPTGVQGWIIGYLYRNREKEVFQRDIQEQFSIRRSTVTGILQLMEKNGLITRSSVAQRAPGGGAHLPLPYPRGEGDLHPAVRENPRGSEPVSERKIFPSYPCFLANVHINS